MGRVMLADLPRFALALMLLWLPGCVALTAVSAVPGALITAAADQFSGVEKSIPTNMQISLAAAQQSLREMKLDADVLEIQEDGGYGIAFGNKKLDGTITLRRQTPVLTTIHVEVRSIFRESSVEDAIIEMIEAKVSKISKKSRFRKKGYNNLRAEPTVSSVQIGWFKPNASLEVSKSEKSEWLKIKLPSGKTGYLKGAIKDGRLIGKK